MTNSPFWKRPGFWSRWGWIMAIQAVVLLLLLFDWAPMLRGYKPWPPEWRWRYQPGENLPALLLMALFGAGMLAAGWLSEKPGTRPARYLLLAGVLLASLGFQLSAIWVRGPDFLQHLNHRTMVTFYEDFFNAAQQIDAPAEAFTRYGYLREEANELRVATHPPGLIWAYRVFIEISEPAAPYLAAGLKLGGGWLAMGGAWLILWALGSGTPLQTGRLLAILGAIPGMALFTVTLDQLAMGFSALAVGCLLCGVRRPGRLWWALGAGAALFAVSMLAYQAMTVAFVAVVAAMLDLWGRSGGARMFFRRIWPTLVIFGGFALGAWIALYAATGYSFLGEFIHGIGAHTKGPIHIHRSRLAWLFWNPWDIAFFIGLAWLAAIVRGRTWRPLLENPLLYALLIMWGIIVLTDGIRGETARIMLFAFPLLAAALLHRNRWLMEGEDYWALGSLLAIQSIAFAAVLHLF